MLGCWSVEERARNEGIFEPGPRPSSRPQLTIQTVTAAQSTKKRTHEARCREVPMTGPSLSARVGRGGKED